MYYLLSSTDLDPDAVTAATGITPTDTWRLGDIHYVTPRLTRYRAYSAWRVKSDPAMSVELEDHVGWVLAQLESGWDRLVELGHRYQAAIVCVIDTAEITGPGMHFDSDVIARFAALNALIDIDYYSYRAGLSED